MRDLTCLMIDSLLLTLYAVAVATGGARLLAVQPWLNRIPRIAIAVWLAAVCSALSAAALASVLLALDSFSVRHTLADLIRKCVMSLHQHYSDVSASALLGIGLLVAATGWLGFHTLLHIVRTRKLRTRQREILRLLSGHPANGVVTVVDHPSSSVYCLPGEGGRIVITTTAVRALTPAQLGVVIAHEQAHLDGRHHLLTGFAGCLAAALPRIPLMRRAGESIDFLVERAADERACRRFSRDTLAAAMLAVGGAAVPGAALGVGGHSVIQRASLLIAGRARSRRQAGLGLMLAASLLAAPVALVATPAVGFDWHNHCLITPRT